MDWQRTWTTGPRWTVLPRVFNFYIQGGHHPPDIGKLLDSEDHWQRRVAVVSTVGLNLKSRGGTGDTPRTLQVCEAVVGDHHEMIQKALSWALRELSKRDRKAVADFIAKHENQLARRVIREVNHKLDFGTKN